LKKLCKKIQPIDSIAVNINMKEIVVGKDENNYVNIPTRINEIHHYKLVAEMLQRKYLKNGKKIKILKEE